MKPLTPAQMAKRSVATQRAAHGGDAGFKAHMQAIAKLPRKPNPTPMPTMTLQQAKDRAPVLRDMIRTGAIEYAAGRRELEKVFVVLNAEADKTAKAHGMRPRKLSITSYLR